MPKLAANLSMMFNEVDFLDRFGAAAEAGFTGVEYVSPYEYDRAEVAEMLRRHRLTQVLFNLPVGDWDAGERGIACHPDRVAEFRAGIDTVIEYADLLGCRQVNCLAGIAPPKASPEALRETFVSNLRFAAKRLEDAGVRLLIEPINQRDISGFYLRNTAHALDVIAEAAVANLYIQYDVYHMQVMEGDLVPTMRANLDSIRHIQIADTPGRNEPGTGEINYPFVLKAIDEMGYPGWVGCEYKPLTTTTEGLGWAANYLGR
jgi:hydroxypyruvate isomerase